MIIKGKGKVKIMAISSVGNYEDVYQNIYVSQNKKTEKKEEDKKEIKPESNEDYVKKLQGKVSYVNLEIGYGLNMRKDKKMGTITMNPGLLEKMKNDPEAEKKYTQLLKDIERAEKTVNSYYNSIGGCVERTSHWYIDENGKYYHFGYVRRDDKLNKKLRLERKENTEKWIEKSRQKAREKAKEQEEKTEKAKEEHKEDVVKDKVEDLVNGKLSDGEHGEAYFDESDMRDVMDAIKKEDGMPANHQVGTNMDMKV